MNDKVYYQFSQIEDIHWWYKYRRRLLEDLLSKLDIKSNAIGLEIGCGTGGSMTYLKNYCSDIIGLDASDLALRLAREKYPEYRFIQGDANKISELFSSETFDLTFIFNVLYHKWILDEVGVLKDVCRILKPGGYLILTEPAFPILWRGHDRLVMGKSRYRIPEFNAMCSSAGFKIIQSTYFNSISFLPALILALFERAGILKIKGEDSEVGELKMAGPLFNKLMLCILNLERVCISKFKSIPLGVSLLSIARKPL